MIQILISFEKCIFISILILEMNNYKSITYEYEQNNKHLVYLGKNHILKLYFWDVIGDIKASNLHPKQAVLYKVVCMFCVLFIFFYDDMFCLNFNTDELNENHISLMFT